MSNSTSDIVNMTWKSQLAESIVTPEQLAERFGIDPEPLRVVAARYPLRITPHTLALIERPGDPIWLQCVPSPGELYVDDLPEDSLNESSFSPVPAVVHRYPDRALLLVSGQCAGYCRFCTRKNRVGTAALAFSAQQITAGLDYISATPGIRDVILTGGDPLLLDDERLEEILTQLSGMPHVEMIRIGSRVPVTLPERITPELCRLLANFMPLYINTHFNHPRELTAAAAEACDRLTRAGIPVGNQSVLMRGINDSVEVMKELGEGLVRMRVRPYYCYQAQLLEGTGHFRVPIERGVEIFRALRGRTSGFAIPQFVLDTPHGKVPLAHPYLRGRDGDDIVVESYDGRLWREPNPLGDSGSG